MKLVKKFINLFKRKSKFEKSPLIEKVGYVCLHEFNSSRRLRRKIKGTRLEYLLIEILKNDNI